MGAGSRVGGDQSVGHAIAAGCGDGVMSEYSRAAMERERERERSSRVAVDREREREGGVGVVAMEDSGSWEAAEGR